MLILTRKIGEMIRIGDEVTVRVLAVRGGQVSLGFTAPDDVRIFREEVLHDEHPAPAGDRTARPRAPMRGACGTTAHAPGKLRGTPATARTIASRSA